MPEPFSDNPRHVLEDVIEAFLQMGQNPLIICAVTGMCFGRYIKDDISGWVYFFHTYHM